MLDLYQPLYLLHRHPRCSLHVGLHRWVLCPKWQGFYPGSMGVFHALIRCGVSMCLAPSSGAIHQHRWTISMYHLGLTFCSILASMFYSYHLSQMWLTISALSRVPYFKRSIKRFFGFCDLSLGTVCSQRAKKTRDRSFGIWNPR